MAMQVLVSSLLNNKKVFSSISICKILLLLYVWISPKFKK